MAQWQRTLDLKDVWESKDIPLIARAAAERLRSMQPFDDVSLEQSRVDIADEFESLAEDTDADTNDFDAVMYNLYEWADTPLDSHFNGKKVCWVATRF